VGKISNNRSRTGWAEPHFGQYSSLAVKLPNCWAMRLNFHQRTQNVKQHLGRRLIRINGVD